MGGGAEIAYTPPMEPTEALDAVGQLPDIEIDLAGAALQLARIDAPHADWRTASQHLTALARETVSLARDMPSGTAAARAGALASLLGRHGYAGDTTSYDDPQNANLIQVIERRRGLPVALGILWLHCTRAAGWAAHGLDFPGHFLIAVEGQTGPAPHPASRVVLDVFSGGAMLTNRSLLNLLRRTEGPAAELRPGVLQPMSARAVLLRLQRNIQLRREASGNLEAALACTENMLRIAPDTVSLWRDAAVLHEQLDQVPDALRCYARVLDIVPEGELAVMAKRAMDGLRSKLH